MKSSHTHLGSRITLKKRVILLMQFFLIISIYHIIKDLKDTVVITGSGAGTAVIPFIKIWATLPITIAISYCFTKIYNRFGSEKTLNFCIISLLLVYIVFAFILYPLREQLYLNNLAEYLKTLLPSGFKGFIAMVCFWHYTLFYVSAELWSLLILTILFWGFLNESISLQEAKKFYPWCMFVGNFAGIISGQLSYFICNNLKQILSWQTTLQCSVIIIVICAILIIVLNHWLALHILQSSLPHQKKIAPSCKFRVSLMSIFRSGPLFCIATLVVGFALTSNLIEVIWKEQILRLHPSPQSYNSYLNRLTTCIGTCAVCMALVSRWIFQILSWEKVALLTPIGLFSTSLLFFGALILPVKWLAPLCNILNINSLYLVITLGSIHYVLAMTAKYTIFDTIKEMSFFSIPVEERMRSKSIIDSIGSRFGKSGASCIYQFVLVVFGSTSGHISVIGLIVIGVIGIFIIMTKKLGHYVAKSLKIQKPKEVELTVH
jgi:ATP:ADP antiporter, AAA family